MPNIKPFLTTEQLVEAVKLTIGFPLSQNSLTFNNVVTFLNQELQLNAVPTLLIEHEEYLVYKTMVPLVSGISRYAIPDRAIGMAIRDIKYSDTNGNFYDMYRVAPDDKAFFQQSGGSNQSVGKFYLEGNEIVVTPQIMQGVSGNLNIFINLRPNYLVRDDRAAIIENFHKHVVISDNSSIVEGDTITITSNVQTQSPVIYTFTAVTSGAGDYEFEIGANANATAINLSNAINNADLDGIDAVVTTNTVGINYSLLSDTFTTTNDTAFTIDNDTIVIKFDNLATSYTDPETDETSTLYEAGCLVDFLQTNPGHRTYTYDVELLSIDGNYGTFNASELKKYLGNSSGGVQGFIPVKIGDYICLQNECIIPQIPPELHHALAERAASRVLMSIGDRDGYAITSAKIAEMDKKQETLIGSRVESSVPKVFNRNSLLRSSKGRFRRRY